jgi:hypothetical protein
MASSNTKTIVYNDWSKGEFGRIAPERAPEGSWTGKNMVVYQNGNIGPRPGLRKIPLTDVPEGEITGIGFVPTPGSSTSAVWFIVGTKVAMFRALGPALDVSLSFQDLDDEVPDGSFVWFKESVRQSFGLTYFTIPEDKGYAFDIELAVLDGTYGIPAGSDIEIYKDRMLVADDGATSPRIYYSSAATFDDFPAENYFDVGASWPISSIIEFKDSLCIFTYDGVWLLTGALTDDNTDVTLRRISETLVPEPRTVLRTNEALFYIPNSRSAPVMYNGTVGDERVLKHLEDWKEVFHDATGMASYGNRDIHFLSSAGTGLWRKNDAWTTHDYEVTVGPYQVRYFDDHIVLTDGGAEGEESNWYTLAMNLNRPAFTSDTLAQPGDDDDTPIDAYIRLPDHVAEVGEEVRVRKVEIEFYDYDTGTVEDNNMDVVVTAINRYRLPGDAEVQTSSYTGPTIEGSEEGVRRRTIRPFGMGGYHGGFSIAIENIRNVAISRVIVDFETREMTPRG